MNICTIYTSFSAMRYVWTVNTILLDFDMYFGRKEGRKEEIL
jgi:hypothetical protein